MFRHTNHCLPRMHALAAIGATILAFAAAPAHAIATATTIVDVELNLVDVITTGTGFDDLTFDGSGLKSVILLTDGDVSHDASATFSIFDSTLAAGSDGSLDLSMDVVAVDGFGLELVSGLLLMNIVNQSATDTFTVIYELSYMLSAVTSAGGPADLAVTGATLELLGDGVPAFAASVFSIDLLGVPDLVQDTFEFSITLAPQESAFFTVGSATGFAQAFAEPVPEPASLALWGVAMTALGFFSSSAKARVPRQTHG